MPATPNEFIRQLLASSSECIKLLDRAGNLLMMSESGQKLLEIDDICPYLGTCWVDWWKGSERVKADGAIAEAQAGRTAQFEAFVTTAKGTPKWWAVTVAPLFGADGKPEQLLSVSRDITERKRTSESRTILESITDAFFALDRDWRFTYVNPQAQLVLDRPYDRLLGKVIWEEYAALIGTEFESAYRLAATERTATSVVSYYPEHDRWYEVHAYPTAEGISVYFRNVSERVRAEEALRESEERFRAAFDQSITGIVLTDLNGRILQANTAFCTFVGRSLEDLQGRDSKRFTHPDDIATNSDILGRLEAQSSSSYVYEKRYLRPDGTVVHAQVSISSTRDSSGQPSGLVAVIEDITARKRAAADHERLLAVEHAAREEAESLAEVGRALSGELDLQALVQKVTDATTTLTRAQFGAFFYNVINDKGESYALYTLSGVPRERFAGFPMPRMTHVFGPTFRGEGVVRSGDITKDERYGKNSLYNGMPKGHLPVRSYLAVSVVSRSGEVLGGLFFGHADTDVFTERDERLIEGIAAQTAIAMDNARLYEALRTSGAKLERSLGQLKAVVDSMTEGVILADPEGNLIEWNSSALKMHGYESLDQVRHHLSKFTETFRISDLDGNQIALSDWPMSRVLRGESFSSLEVHVLRRDTGRDWIISYSGTPIRDSSGTIQLALLTLHDMTAERRAQTAVRQSERRFRELADAMPQMVWVARPDGHHEYFNRRWYEFTGLPEGATDGELWSNVLHPDDQERAQTIWTQCLATGESYEIEYRLRHVSGGYRWALARALPVRNERGEIERWFGTCTNIDSMKRMTQEREQVLARESAARAEAEAASKMKDEFLATLSHELRTPLSAILGWSQILGRGNARPETLAEGIATIERNARAQTQIIEDLLDMSRIISGKISLSPQRVNLSAAVRAAIDTVRPSAAAKEIQIIFDKPATARHPILGDLNRLQQVFWNLLSNGIKFTPRGGVVEVRIEQRQSHWEVDVVDSGEGISAEFLPYVFDRFRQADASTTRKHGGLGLGLAIVKQLIELHGGHVRVRSNGLGSGSTFTVSLPISVVHEDVDGPSDASSKGATVSSTSSSVSVREGMAWDAGLCDGVRGAKVLVVDDEADARGLLKQLLADCGCAVLTAATASEAIDLLQRERPDVLVSDIGMPGRDGYALLRSVRQLGHDAGGDTPAIALTAYARAEDRVKAVRAGFQMHVPKPVEPAELITMVATLLKRK